MNQYDRLVFFMLKPAPFKTKANQILQKYDSFVFVYESEINWEIMFHYYEFCCLSCMSTSCMNYEYMSQ